MNSTRAVEVSIQAVSPELIFDESTENGAVGAAGAASDAAAAPDAASAPGATATGDAESGALAGAAAVVSEAAADAAAGADASWASAEPTLAPSSDPAINKDINNLRILVFPLIANFLLESVRAGFPGANADDLFNRCDENLAVP